MPQINQTSFLRQKSKCKNLKPGGLKKALQEKEAMPQSAIYPQDRPLSTKTALRSFAPSITQHGKNSISFLSYEDLSQNEDLEFFYEETMGFSELQTISTSSKISNASEDDDELDGPDEDEEEEEEEEEDEYDEDEEEDDEDDEEEDDEEEDDEDEDDEEEDDEDNA
jgi:hypothetical protein